MLVAGLGASAGGVEALRSLVARLPDDFPGAVLVVLHVPPEGTSMLPSILDRSGPLRAHAAEDGQRLEPGTIVVAPPDRHLLLGGDRLALSGGPRVNRHRPAIDPTFSSMADSVGSEAVGVILSGALDDGTHGLADIVAAGGTALLQDPAEALHSGMVRSAMRHVCPHTTLPVARIAAALVERAALLSATDHPPAGTPMRRRGYEGSSNVARCQ